MERNNFLFCAAYMGWILVKVWNIYEKNNKKFWGLLDSMWKIRFPHLRAKRLKNKFEKAALGTLLTFYLWPLGMHTFPCNYNSHWDKDSMFFFNLNPITHAAQCSTDGPCGTDLPSPLHSCPAASIINGPALLQTLAGNQGCACSWIFTETT